MSHSREPKVGIFYSNSVHDLKPPEKQGLSVLRRQTCLCPLYRILKKKKKNSKLGRK